MSDSPYRFTVSVEQPVNRPEVWQVHIRRYHPNPDRCDHDWWMLDTEAEARSHAALVLAALHQAEMEL